MFIHYACSKDLKLFGFLEPQVQNSDHLYVHIVYT